MSPHAEPPISRIPPEILVRILEFCPLDEDLVAATHVCHFWRAALISAPCLWTRIPCCDVDHTSTYLERSKPAPIDVLAAETSLVIPSDSALALVIPHLGRVRSMEISPAPREIFQSIFNFRSPAPLLQRLEISGYPSPLPVDFLGGHTPSLRFFHWGGAPPKSAFFRLPDPIHPPPHNVDVALPQDVVWGLLSSSPNLQYVSITISDEEESPDVTPAHHIHLNSLHRLRMVPGVAFSRIIPYIKAPQLKVLSLVLPPGTEDWTIADLLPSDSFPLMREVTTMDFRTGAYGSEVRFEGEDTKVTINVPYQDVADMDDFFNSTAASFSFTQITKLTFGMASAVPLAPRIGEFENLQLLDLVRCRADAELFSALSPSLQSGPLVPCPHLRSMTVHLYKPTTYVVDSFKRMLRSRKEAGKPLITVNIVSSPGWEWIGDIGEWLGPAPILE